MRFRYFRPRLLRMLATLGLAGTLGACDSLLEVENPGAVQDEQLSDTTQGQLLVSTVVSDFQQVYTDLAYYGAVFTDEAVTGHNFETIKEIDLRILRKDNGTANADIYTPLQQARFSADSLAGRYRQLYPNPTPAQQIGLARMLTYGGYTYQLLGEYFCEAPINGGAAVPSAELIRTGIARFDEAIRVASAVKGDTSRAARARSASADSIINLARIGAARAYLQLDEKAKAIELASQVPAGFTFRVFHSDNKEFQENPYYGATTGTNQNLGVGPSFRGLNDPRVQHTATSRTGHNGLTQLFRPYQAPSFSEFETGDTVQFRKQTSVRFASGLEARYIVAEAEGPTAATLAFVNERRAAGGQAPVTLSGDALMAELRDQRRRDFFLDGHRLGDLRRYKATGAGDFFPQGAHPNADWGNYGDAECFIPSINEELGNPNF